MQADTTPIRRPRRLVAARLRWLLWLTLLASCDRPPATPPAAAPATLAAPEVTPAVVEPAADPSPTAPPPPATPATTGDLALLPPGRLSAGDPYAPELGNTGYDVRHYLLKMALDPADPQLRATATIEAIAGEDGLAALSLDFVGFNIVALTVDGEAAEYGRLEDKLLIALPRPLATGAPFTVQVEYEGRPVTRSSLYLPFLEHVGLHYPDSQSLFVLSEPDGARFWFPCNDHPRDKATFRFELIVPDGLTGVANGRLVASQTAGGGSDLYVWQHDYPMATYLATVAVGDYQRLEGRSPDGIPIRDYVFPHLVTDFRRAAAVTGEALDWMSDLFGPYPFEAYGHVTVRAAGVSLETQTMVLLAEGMIDERTIIHEMAHMWFGDWVSLDSWGDMWRNEGFATYVSFMWETRDDREALELLMAGVMEAAAERDGDRPLDELPPDELFSRDSYIGGAALVHALRLEVGDEAYFSGLRAYFARYGGRTASQAEFITVMEAAAGRPLDDFFTPWLGEGR